MWHCLCLDPKRNQTLPGIPKSGIWDCWAVLVQPELFSCSFQRNSLQEGNCPILGRTSSAAISQINSQIPTLFPRIPSIPSFPSSFPNISGALPSCIWDLGGAGISPTVEDWDPSSSRFPGSSPAFPSHPTFPSHPSSVFFQVFPVFPRIHWDNSFQWLQVLRPGCGAAPRLWKNPGFSSWIFPVPSSASFQASSGILRIQPSSREN